MGGYVDLNIYQLQSPLAQDIGSDLNFLMDPEAAQIAITAPLYVNFRAPASVCVLFPEHSLMSFGTNLPRHVAAQ